MGVYVCLLYFGALLSPILGGYIYTGLGWKAIIVRGGQNNRHLARC